MTIVISLSRCLSFTEFIFTCIQVYRFENIVTSFCFIAWHYVQFIVIKTCAFAVFCCAEKVTETMTFDYLFLQISSRHLLHSFVFLVKNIS